MRDFNILVITNDYTYMENTKREASRRNLTVDYVRSMEEALAILSDKDYLLVVICADTVDYLPLIKDLKRLKPMPVIVFSYLEPADKTEALKMGADVYIVAPYSIDYIVESSYALAQLYANSNGYYADKQPEFLTYGYIRVCVDSRQVFVKGKLVDLTKNDFDLLCLLMRNKGIVITYAEIYRRVWGEEYTESSINTISSAVHRLKKKLGIAPGTDDYIKNVHQTGYSFDPS